AIMATTSLTKQGSGTLTLNGANSYTGSTLIQTGVVALASGATLASTNISISPNATLDATASGGLTLAAGQSFGGSGTVASKCTDGSATTISRGLSAGTLTINGTLALAGGGRLNLEVTNNTAIGGGTNDLILVHGNVSLAASTTVNLSFLAGVPSAG